MTKSAKSQGSTLKRHFLMGVAVGAPVVLTLWLVWSAVLMIDGWVMPFVPRHVVPTDSILRMIPGTGVIIFMVSAVALGLLTRGLVGRSLVRASDRLFDRLPVVRSIYSSVKQITDTVFGQDAPKFDKACLIEYPRKGSWSIGFISTKARGEISAKLLAEAAAPQGDEKNEILSIFVPTTPNPTSGFLLYARAEEIRVLDMAVDDAVKLVISAGLVYPDDKKAQVTEAQIEQTSA